MKIAACVSALLFTLVAASGAGAQTFASPGVSKMTAAYDPTAGAVVITEPQRHVDYQVQPAQAQTYQPPAQVYQPPGRVYGVADPFSATGPQTVTAPGYPAYGAPATVAPYGAAPAAPYGGATTMPPMTGYSPGVYADPYACQPYCGPQPSMVAPLGVGASIPRSPYTEIEGRFGDPAEVLQTNLVLPFWQQPNVHWFFDLRGQYDDERAGEGNFGIARRELLSNGLITTVYAFYDIRHTRFNNNFQQGMIGFEMMSLDWEYRVNGYLPFSGAQTTGVNMASLDGSNNIVVRQGLEKAYHGMDAEYGWLMTKLGDTNSHELRAFLGGYWFDTSDAGFPSIAGPRGRLEGRVYDLPLLGAGSRFTYGASYQYDNVRNSQWIASVNLRIPFGGGRSRGAGLSPIDRRMMSPLRRDEAIVTGGTFGAPEQAVISSTGQLATNVTVVDTGATAVADVAGGGDIVVVTNNVDIAATGPIALNPGQFVGGQFQVEGQTTGAKALFGQKFTVTVGAGANVFELADNSTITGLTVSGGANGIAGAAVNGFTVNNSTISGATNAAINLTGTNAGDITSNTLLGGGSTADGLLAVELAGASTITGNTASGFTNDGFQITTLTSGDVLGNTATSNSGDGFFVTNLNGGSITGNTATQNGDEGFEVNTINAGVFSNNVSTGNTQTGYDFISALGGTITGNRATGNGVGGADDGFQFSTLNGADVQFNLSENNTEDGFQITTFTSGTFSNNTANNNTAQGYNAPAPGGAAAGNTGTGNGSNDAYP